MTGKKKSKARARKRTERRTEQPAPVVEEAAPPPPAPAARAYNLRIIRNAMTPLANADGSKRQFGPYLPILNACEICPSRCCRLTVKVSLPDALRFCNVLGLPFFAGMTLVPSILARAFRVDHDKRVNPTLTAEWPGSAEIALRRREDGGCAMLVEVGGYDRCGVYAARPSTCRLYPMTWTADVARGGPALVMCPVPYGVSPAAEEQFFADAKDSIERWQIHDRVIDEWHALDGDRSVERFLAFALPRTAELLGESATRALSSGGPIGELQAAMQKAGILR